MTDGRRQVTAKALITPGRKKKVSLCASKRSDAPSTKSGPIHWLCHHNGELAAGVKRTWEKGSPGNRSFGVRISHEHCALQLEQEPPLRENLRTPQSIAHGQVASAVEDVWARHMEVLATLGLHGFPDSACSCARGSSRACQDLAKSAQSMPFVFADSSNAEGEQHQRIMHKY